MISDDFRLLHMTMPKGPPEVSGGRVPTEELLVLARKDLPEMDTSYVLDRARAFALIQRLAQEVIAHRWAACEITRGE
jgi:hypothetical protein